MNRIENQTLALAAMFQAVILVDELATHGNYDLDAFNCCFESLFTINAGSTEEALGELTELTRGLEAMAVYLGGENRSPGRNIAYYLLSLAKISSQVLDNPVLSEKLLDGLQQIEKNATDFDLGRSSIINKIDGLYQDSISSLQPRIIVRGEQNYLLNNDNAARIRVLLLAGIRAAVLWRQLGGSKWNLFWQRKKYVRTALGFLQKH